MSNLVNHYSGVLNLYDLVYIENLCVNCIQLVNYLNCVDTLYVIDKILIAYIMDWCPLRNNSKPRGTGKLTRDTFSPRTESWLFNFHGKRLSNKSLSWQLKLYIQLQSFQNTLWGFFSTMYDNCFTHVMFELNRLQFLWNHLTLH